MRQPLARMQVAVPAAARGPALDSLLELLRLEVNVKEVQVVASDADLVRLRAKPNFRSLGKRYGKRTPAVARPRRRAHAPTSFARSSRRRLPSCRWTASGSPILPEDVVVEREVASDWLVAAMAPTSRRSTPHWTTSFGRRATPARWSTGSSGCGRTPGTCTPTASGSGSTAMAPCSTPCAGTREYIQAETLARQLELGSRAPAPDLEQEVDIDGHGVVVGVQRHEDGRNGAAPQTRVGE